MDSVERLNVLMHGTPEIFPAMTMLSNKTIGTKGETTQLPLTFGDQLKSILFNLFRPTPDFSGLNQTLQENELGVNPQQRNELFEILKERAEMQFNLGLIIFGTGIFGMAVTAARILGPILSLQPTGETVSDTIIVGARLGSLLVSLVGAKLWTDSIAARDIINSNKDSK